MVYWEQDAFSRGLTTAPEIKDFAVPLHIVQAKVKDHNLYDSHVLRPEYA